MGKDLTVLNNQNVPRITESADMSGLPLGEPLQLIFDGGCPFCAHFAHTSELRGGVAGLQIIDGRADAPLRRELKVRGLNLAEGAVLLQGDRCWHGAEAIQHLCSLLQPSVPLLALLTSLFRGPGRSHQLYPLLLLARRIALTLKGLPVDPDRS